MKMGGCGGGIRSYMTLGFKHSVCELLIFLVLFPLCIFVDLLCYFSTVRNSRDEEVPVHAMWVYKETDAYLHSFLTSSLSIIFGSIPLRLNSRLNRAHSPFEPFGTERKSLTLQGFELWIFHPLPNRYPVYTIPVVKNACCRFL
jgi:hypothetical protein